LFTPEKKKQRFGAWGCLFATRNHAKIACQNPFMLGSFEGGSIGQDMAKMDKLLKGAANPSQAILSCTQ